MYLQFVVIVLRAEERFDWTIAWNGKHVVAYKGRQSSKDNSLTIHRYHDTKNRKIGKPAYIVRQLFIEKLWFIEVMDSTIVILYCEVESITIPLSITITLNLSHIRPTAIRRLNKKHPSIQVSDGSIGIK